MTHFRLHLVDLIIDIDEHKIIVIVHYVKVTLSVLTLLMIAPLSFQDSGQLIPLVVESCIRYINLYGKSHMLLWSPVFLH